MAMICWEVQGTGAHNFECRFWSRLIQHPCVHQPRAALHSLCHRLQRQPTEHTWLPQSSPIHVVSCAGCLDCKICRQSHSSKYIRSKATHMLTSPSMKALSMPVRQACSTSSTAKALLSVVLMLLWVEPQQTCEMRHELTFAE